MSARSSGRVDKARAALAVLEKSSPVDAGYARVLLQWALGENVAAQLVHKAITDATSAEATSFIVARQDIDSYNAYMESSGEILQAYYFVDLIFAVPA